MGCVITAGIAAPACGARFSSPGIDRTKLWVFNYDEIAAFTSSVTGEVDAITLDSLKVGFKLDVHKNSAMFTEELQSGEESAPFYNQSLTARIIATDTATMTAIEDMVDVDLVIVYKGRNGKFRLAGEHGGVKLTENTYESGKIAGDAVGDTLVFTGQANGKARFFFDTSEAASEVTLDSYL